MDKGIFDRDCSHSNTALLIYLEQSTDLTWSQALPVKDAATRPIGNSSGNVCFTEYRTLDLPIPNMDEQNSLVSTSFLRNRLGLAHQ